MIYFCCLFRPNRYSYWYDGLVQTITCIRRLPSCWYIAVARHPVDMMSQYIMLLRAPFWWYPVALVSVMCAFKCDWPFFGGTSRGVSTRVGNRTFDIARFWAGFIVPCTINFTSSTIGKSRSFLVATWSTTDACYVRVGFLLQFDG